MLWVAVIRGIVNTYFFIWAWYSRNASASLRFRRRTFTRVIYGNSLCGSSTCITIGFSITTTDRIEFSCANGGLGFTDTLCVSYLALADTEITILIFIRTDQSLDSAANSFLGCRRWEWLRRFALQAINKRIAQKPINQVIRMFMVIPP
ncbi:hypothetical protein C8R11_1058 [Nitrosomonas aestuarii]|nr:hypothetical protein C8R11_1058 [Nitrosomonas aestuarii]